MKSGIPCCGQLSFLQFDDTAKNFGADNLCYMTLWRGFCGQIWKAGSQLHQCPLQQQ
jgi:hypothetical protein